MINYDDFLKLFEKKAKIFFVGIGGVSMSSLAMISKNAGLEVSGYDFADNEVTERLKSAGIPVYKEFDEKEFEGVETVVFTGAVKDSSDFLRYPREKGIPVVKRGEFLGFLMKKSRNPIGIAGTHGKSTTTGMISSEFLEAKRDPTVIIGAEADLPDKTFKVGNGGDFIFEACEYQDSFLSFFPKISVILNVFHDHADYFPTFESVVDSFVKWADLASDGVAVINADDVGAMLVAGRTKSKIFTFSAEKEADITARDISSEGGLYSFTLVIRGEEKCKINLKVFGKHNVSNALAAASAGYLSGLTVEEIKAGIEKYRGIKRRFEYRGKCGKMRVFDDYAHHPDEIMATLTTAREAEKKSITVVFQSHTYTRTRAYFDNFVSSLSLADEVIYADIYAAREKEIEGINAKALAERTPNGKYLGDFGKISEYLRSLDREGMLIIMGAGDVVNITPTVLDKE